MLISWVIGGVAIVILALVHAELGGMYPVSGGTARFPHYAFGGVAGASFGWFAWLNAATVAPIEVSAVLTYMGHYGFAEGWIDPDTQVLSSVGIVVAVILMALMVAINLLGVRMLAATNSAMTWWKIAIPLLTILVLSINNFDTGNLHAADGFNPDGLKGILTAVSTGGIIFSYLGFEQADQLAGEAANPKRDVPWAVIGSVLLGTIIYILLQVAFLFSLPQEAIGSTWASQAARHLRHLQRPLRRDRHPARHRLAGHDHLHRRVRQPGRHRPHLHHRQLAPGLRPVAQRLRPVGLRVDQRARRAVGRASSRRSSPAASASCRSRRWQSLVGLITSASVLMYGGGAALTGRLPAPPPRCGTPVPAARGVAPVARWRS